MAKQTAEQKLLALIDQLKAPAPSKVKGKDISKALSLFKKSQDFLTQAIALLEDNNNEGDTANTNKTPEYEANVAKYPEAQFGRKLDGTPRKPSGRQSLKANGGSSVGIFAGADTDRPGHGGSNVSDAAPDDLFNSSPAPIKGKKKA